MEQRKNRIRVIGLVVVVVLGLGAFTGLSLMSKWNRASQALEDIPAPPDLEKCVYADNSIELVAPDGGKVSMFVVFNPGFKGKKLFTCGVPPIDTIVTLNYKYTENGQWVFDSKTVALARPETAPAPQEQELPKFGTEE